MTCKFPNCSKIHKAKGYCNTHYQRYLKFGDPFTLKVVQRGGDPRHPAYHVYNNMLFRCSNPKQSNFVHGTAPALVDI